MSPAVDACPHRRPVPDGPPGSAECRLLVGLAGFEAGPLARVDRDACASCLGEIPPDESGLNPTLASLLYRLARGVVERGGVPGCPAGRARQLAERAEADLGLRWAEVPSVTPARRDPGRRPRVGLIGWNTPSGLGQLNRDLARHLPADRWLIPKHPAMREVEEPPACPAWRGTEPGDLDRFLDGLDGLLFCEHPYLASVVPMARARGVRVACVPMWEYLDEMAPWVRQVDLMIAPTRVGLDVVARCRERLGLRFDVEHLPWPIDGDRFPFRQRGACDRFLFVNGNGGAREVGGDRPRWDGRKGAGVVAEASRRAPGVPILVRSQTACLPEFPPHVEVRVGDLDDPAGLYDEGDACIQPSRWEGLGLPMLECQASGLPLITTDAPPMNEHRPLRALDASTTRARISGHRTIPAREVDPADLARALVELHGSDLSEASRRARRFVEQEHSWDSARARILSYF